MAQEASTTSQHDDQAEWTHVKRKSRGNKRHVDPKAVVGEPLKPRTSNLRCLEELQADYHKIRAQWEDTACRTQLGRNVAENAVSDKIVNRAVCLGIGTFDPVDGAWEAKRRTYVQLIAFLVMVEELENMTDQKISCFFQEPIFTESDKAFVASLGHEVVESPKGCDMIDESTLLFAVHLYRPIYAMTLKNHLPAVFVGTGWDVWDSVTLAKPDDLDNMETMEKTYTKCPFPQDSGSTAFSSTSIYWRPGPRDKIDDKEEPQQGATSKAETTVEGMEEKLNDSAFI